MKSLTLTAALSILALGIFPLRGDSKAATESAAIDAVASKQAHPLSPDDGQWRLAGWDEVDWDALSDSAAPTLAATNPHSPDNFSDTSGQPWVTVTMHRLLGDGARQEVQLLRPQSWVGYLGLSEGEHFEFAATERTFNGTFLIDDIELVEKDFGPLEQDGTRMVTGTFKTENSRTYTLTLQDGTEIRGTSAHPLYSLDRSDWAGLAEMLPGERLRTQGGQAVVQSVVEHPERETVYNLEVHGVHQYFVGGAGVLSHNMEPCLRRSPRNHANSEVPNTARGYITERAITRSRPNENGGNVTTFATRASFDDIWDSAEELAVIGRNVDVLVGVHGGQRGWRTSGRVNPRDGTITGDTYIGIAAHPGEVRQPWRDTTMHRNDVVTNFPEEMSAQAALFNELIRGDGGGTIRVFDLSTMDNARLNEHLRGQNDVVVGTCWSSNCPLVR